MDYQKAIETHINECRHRIDVIRNHMNTNGDADKDSCFENIKVLETAISAMQELQEYHETGLSAKQASDNIHELSATKRVLGHYQQLGTLEECKEAVEKQKAISREIIEGKYFCPKCHNLMPYPGYCGCGQKLY